MVGLSIMGASAPVMMDMSLAPIIAQKRAQNLGVAETAATVFAATYGGKTEIPPTVEGFVHQRIEKKPTTRTASPALMEPVSMFNLLLVLFVLPSLTKG